MINLLVNIWNGQMDIFKGQSYQLGSERQGVLAQGNDSGLDIPGRANIMCKGTEEFCSFASAK